MGNGLKATRQSEGPQLNRDSLKFALRAMQKYSDSYAVFPKYVIHPINQSEDGMAILTLIVLIVEQMQFPIFTLVVGQDLHELVCFTEPNDFVSFFIN